MMTRGITIAVACAALHAGTVCADEPPPPAKHHEAPPLSSRVRVLLTGLGGATLPFFVGPALAMGPGLAAGLVACALVAPRGVQGILAPGQNAVMIGLGVGGFVTWLGVPLAVLASTGLAWPGVLLGALAAARGDQRPLNRAWRNVLVATSPLAILAGAASFLAVLGGAVLALGSYLNFLVVMLSQDGPPSTAKTIVTLASIAWLPVGVALGFTLVATGLALNPWVPALLVAVAQPWWALAE